MGSPFNPSTDPTHQFLNALPDRARNQIQRTDRITILIHRAIHEHGWTPEQLAARCTGDLGANPGGTITYRLARDSQRAPPDQEKKVHKIHDRCCDNGWIYDETTDPPTQRRCRGNETT